MSDQNGTSQADTLSPSASTSYSSPTSTPYTVFDYLGLAFILGPPGVWVEVWMKGEHLPVGAWLFGILAILIGAACIAIGRNWVYLKTKVWTGIVNVVEALSHSYITLLIAFVTLLVIVVMAPLLIWPTTTIIVQPSISPSKVIASFPVDFPFELVTEKKFYNERVVLDGKEFVHCSFTNITFVYNGTAPVKLHDNDLYGTRVF